MALLVISGSDGSDGSAACGESGCSRLYFSMVRLPVLNSPNTLPPRVPVRSPRVATFWLAGEPSTV